MAEEALNAEKEALDSYFQGEDADIRVREWLTHPNKGMLYARVEWACVECGGRDRGRRNFHGQDA